MFSEIHCVATGKVQRVGYRDFIEQYAKEHDIYGWIKNNENGSVEIVLQGTPDELKACIEILHEGSLLAQVDSLAVDWGTPKKQFDEFKILSSR